MPPAEDALKRFRLAGLVFVAAAASLRPAGPGAQNLTAPSFAGAMRWRPIGPFRGGRTKAITGVPSDQNVFYMAPVNGGVWKTTDFGRTWTPIFDDQPTGSVGSIAVAPSDPKVIYVGSGEGLARPDLSVGDGIYKSIDAGKTWTHLGLRDGQQIPVHHRRPAQSESAVRRRARPSLRAERGARRLSLDRRRRDVPESPVEGREHRRLGPRIRSEESRHRLRRLWEQRQGPWENGAWAGTTGGIFKSIDGGGTWRQLTRGLPAEGIVQADIAVAPSDGESPLRDGRQSADRRASIDRTTPARTGRRSPATLVPPGESAAAICRCRRSIRKIPTP